MDSIVNQKDWIVLNMEVRVGAQEVETGWYRSFVAGICVHLKDYSLMDVIYYIYTAIYLTNQQHARLILSFELVDVCDRLA